MANSSPHKINLLHLFITETYKRKIASLATLKLISLSIHFKLTLRIHNDRKPNSKDRSHQDQRFRA